MVEETTGQRDTFARFGRSYQEKVLQALIQDFMFAEQMCDMLRPEHFELRYLQKLAERFYGYKQKYKTYPSTELLETMVTRDDEDADAATIAQVREYLSRIASTPLNGDAGYIKDSSLEFVKKQVLKEAMIKSIDLMESGNYDTIQTVIKDALHKGTSHDLGHNYLDGFEARGAQSARQPIPTGWKQLDDAFNGGWERKTLSTFIAPTGAGKSMFLVNCGAAAMSQGLNVVYVTLEMADFKIGLRFDSYYSGVEINNIPNHRERVEQAVRSKAKGHLRIKEYPCKTATVQTLRAYLQRLLATENFKADVLIVDYADLLRSSRTFGDLRFELQGTYEELRALAQEFNIVVITADQTNRAGLEMELVTIAQIGEAYSKAQICDVIMTISRTTQDKQSNMGRIFLAKSRLGRDGIIFPFLMNTDTVKADLLTPGGDPIAALMENRQQVAQDQSDRFGKMLDKKNQRVVAGA